MKSNAKRNITIIGVIFIISALIIPASALARMGGGHMGGGYGMHDNQMGGGMGKGLNYSGRRMEAGMGGGFFGLWRNPVLVKDLNLSEEQVKSLKDNYFAVKEKHIDLRNKLAGLHLEMDKALSADAVDEKRVLELTREISSVKSDLYVSRVENKLAAKKILTKEQLDKLNTLGCSVGFGRHNGSGLGHEMGRGYGQGAGYGHGSMMNGANGNRTGQGFGMMMNSGYGYGMNQIDPAVTTAESADIQNM